MRVLVTGANGHLGNNLVRQLLARGDEVIAFVRKSADVRGLAGLNVSYRYGDVLDAASVDAAIDGLDTVFHTAAVYATKGKPEDIIRPAVDGAKHVFAACARAGVKKVVYTSSIAAVGFARTLEEPRTEKDWNAEPVNAYYTAKTDSERIVWKLSEQYGLPTVVINPAVILGPLDLRITPSTGFIRDALNGKATVVRGATCLVHVEDVALAHVLGDEKGVPGQRYIAGGDNLTYAGQVERCEALSGSKNARMMYPRWVLMSAIGAMELAAKITGKEPGMTSDSAAEVIDRYAVFDTTKIRTELGLQPRSADDTIRDTARWLAYSGALDAAVAARVREQLPPDPSWAALGA